VGTVTLSVLGGERSMEKRFHPERTVAPTLWQSSALSEDLDRGHAAFAPEITG
jgi:hypothetical protein